MKKFKDLLFKVSLEKVVGSTHIDVAAICFDSRKCGPADVFVAISGTAMDGHQFIEQAVTQGVRAIVCERMPAQQQKDVTYVQVANSSEALAHMAANYYGHPSHDLQLIGVTGTNGKTTTTTLLFELFSSLGYECGLISTVNVRIGNKIFDTKNTTPDPLTINSYLAQMRDAGATYCFMEVSSHGIAQHRITALKFAVAMFTNLSHDHLDYHKTFAEYRDTKKKLFDGLPADAIAITNKDDRNGLYMLQNTKAKKVTYALKSHADHKAKIIENHFSGLQLQIDGKEFWCRLVGRFNAYNLLAIYCVGLELSFRESELTQDEILEKMSILQGVSGRFQHFTTTKEKVTAIVDYAHTPDALQNVLETVNSIRTKNEQLITVVGCGGDRDATRRPEMASIAAELSDKVILTSDNPRSEDPLRIIQDMEAGVQTVNVSKVLSITDRAQAIKTAAQLAAEGDIIIIAGKGHETYQEINGVRHDFDDNEHIKTALKTLGK
jgi:UDP-N-acetylmuramoyl-L-alanyl-D-glutamate--2,6-diaminopimelate ligase